MIVKYWLHDNYDFSEIIEHLKEQHPTQSDAWIRKVAEDIRGTFYEIGFSMKYDENGKRLSEPTIIK